MNELLQYSHSLWFLIMWVAFKAERPTCRIMMLSALIYLSLIGDVFTILGLDFYSLWDLLTSEEHGYKYGIFIYPIKISIDFLVVAALFEIGTSLAIRIMGIVWLKIGLNIALIVEYNTSFSVLYNSYPDIMRTLNVLILLIGFHWAGGQIGFNKIIYSAFMRYVFNPVGQAWVLVFHHKKVEKK